MLAPVTTVVALPTVATFVVEAVPRPVSTSVVPLAETAVIRATPPVVVVPLVTTITAEPALATEAVPLTGVIEIVVALTVPVVSVPLP